MTQNISVGAEYLPWEARVALGRQRNQSHVYKYGYNPAVGTSVETIWFQGDVYTWPTAAATLELTSTHNTDEAAAGAGMRSVTLEGLDANYAEISETLVLTGQTAKLSAKSYLRVHRMYGATYGANATNTGVVYAANSSGTHTTGTPGDLTLVYSTIGAGKGQTLQCFYTVPAGKKALVYAVEASCFDNTNVCTMEFRAREYGTGWRTKDQFVVFQGQHESRPAIPWVFPEKTDLELRGTGGGTVVANGTFDILLIDM